MMVFTCLVFAAITAAAILVQEQHPALLPEKRVPIEDEVVEVHTNQFRCAGYTINIIKVTDDDRYWYDGEVIDSDGHFVGLIYLGSSMFKGMRKDIHVGLCKLILNPEEKYV